MTAKWIEELERLHLEVEHLKLCTEKVERQLIKFSEEINEWEVY